MEQKKIVATLNEYQMKDITRMACHGVRVANDGWAEATDGHRAFKTLGLILPDGARGRTYAFDAKGFRGLRGDEHGAFPDTSQVWPSDRYGYWFEFTRDKLPKPTKLGDQACAVLTDGTLVVGEHRHALVHLSMKYLLDVPDDCTMVIKDHFAPVHFIGIDWQALIMPQRSTVEFSCVALKALGLNEAPKAAPDLTTDGGAMAVAE